MNIKFLKNTATVAVGVMLLFSTFSTALAEIILLAPTISNLALSQASFIPSAGETIKLTYDVKSLVSKFVDIEIMVSSKTNPALGTVFHDAKNVQTGSNEYVWDGIRPGGKGVDKFFSPGLYNLAVQVNGNPSTLKSIDFQIVGATLSTPTFSRSVYNPLKDGQITISTILKNSSNATLVTARVYSENDANKTSVWSSHYSNQAPGVKDFQWNGYNINSQQLAAGTYVAEVSGKDGDYTLPTSSNSFIIAYNNDPANNCAGFPDVSATDLSCSAFTYTKSIGVMTGNGDGTLQPDAILQRDQVAKIALTAGKLFNSNTNYCAAGNPFPDISIADWAFQYICAGKTLGIIKGYTAAPYAGLYKPALSVNRVEFLALILRALNKQLPDISFASYNDVAGGLWFSPMAKYSLDHGLFAGANLYPEAKVTRREASQILYKLHLQGEL